MIRRDGNADGMLEGAQPNTLDADWYGKISFISSLYLAMLKAGEAMAIEMGDERSPSNCREIAKRGRAVDPGDVQRRVLRPDRRSSSIRTRSASGQAATSTRCSARPGPTGSGWAGCSIATSSCSALRALWKYNFVPDVGPFREQFVPGRWYAAAGDAGLIMCSWPKGGKNPAFKNHWQYGYFNECMTGFEYQAAAHMIWEGLDQPDLLQNGLAVTRAIHDRYNAALRNPYNEIECSDHYSRAMASYGVFQAVCGFHCHGPQGHLEFAPRLGRDDFRAAFTSAEGWGTISQHSTVQQQINTITVRHGQLRLKTLAVSVENRTPSTVKARVGEESTAEVTLQVVDGRARVEFSEPVLLQPGTTLHIELA